MIESPTDPSAFPAKPAPTLGHPTTVHARRGGALSAVEDCVALEEPLDIRLAAANGARTISITMRTPGHDFELVAGFLLSEGIVDSRDEILDIAYCLDADPDPDQRFNVVTALIAGEPGRASLERLVITSSACGVCGAASIEAVRLAGHPTLGRGPTLPFSTLARLPEQLRAGQKTFAATGGVHGIGLFSPDGTLHCLREDVGRHNAVDKVVGWAMLTGLLPLTQSVLMVSGRISFEIVQKSLRAGIPIVAAVSAATSLAVRLATESGMTLVGFVRGESCTVYSGRERLVD